MRRQPYQLDCQRLGVADPACPMISESVMRRGPAPPKPSETTPVMLEFLIVTQGVADEWVLFEALMVMPPLMILASITVPQAVMGFGPV